MIKFITGLQWGDEGKRSISHFESIDAVAIVRGIAPSEIETRIMNIVGDGGIIDVEKLIEQITRLQEQNIHITPDNFVISKRAQVIMPWHILLDELYEKLLGDTKNTIIMKGMEPCYEEMCRGSGIRIIDLLDKETLREKIKASLRISNIILGKSGEAVHTKEVLEKYLKYGEVLEPYIKDTTEMLQKMMKKKSKIILEDMPNGTCIGAGIGPAYIDEVIGVIKPYTSSKKPFPTEQRNSIGKEISEMEHKCDTMLDESLRYGWLDLPMIRREILVRGINVLAITHLDVIGNLLQTQICKAHEVGRIISKLAPAEWEKSIPIYESFFGGWDITQCKAWEEIPQSAKRYIKWIETHLGVPVKYIKIGQEDSKIIICPDHK